MLLLGDGFVVGEVVFVQPLHFWEVGEELLEVGVVYVGGVGQSQSLQLVHHLGG